MDEEIEELRVILQEISEARDRLYSIAESHELSHPDLVQASQEMDKLLNRYWAFVQKSKL